ncbi:MAG: gliding motility-associated C-terminal domain-containing protein [Bacteroidales bacterium]|nr:gliding motility-associated C-terminal domain-containing protein [Bacteroidales bacterium]
MKVIFKNLTQELLIDNYTYEWMVEQGKYSTQADSVQNTYVNPGTYTVTMKVYDKSKKLVETVTKENYITVYRDPDVTITSDVQSTCENKPFQFSIESIDSDAEIISYTWVLSDGSSYLSETIPPYTFGRADDFVVFLSITNANGCSNRERKPITVHTTNDYPSVSFSADKRKSCEEQLNVSFTNTTDEDNVMSYHWDFGDGTTYDGKTPPKHLYKGYGRYYAMLAATSKNNCVSNAAQTIQLIDYHTKISITDNSPEVSFDVANYNTYMEQDSLSTCPCKHQGSSSIDYKVITDGNKACIGPVTFTDSTLSNDNISWEWTLQKKDPVTQQLTIIATSKLKSFSEDITESGTYVVTLKTSNGICTGQSTRTFEVEEPLDISVTPESGFFCDNPAVVEYAATSNIPGTNFLWYFKDSKTLYLGDTYKATYKNEGVYQSKLYAISPNSCKYSTVTSKEIEITRPKLDYYPYHTSYDITGAYKEIPISGCKPLDVDFNVYYWYHTDQDSVKSITWNFGDYDNTSFETTYDTKIKDGSNGTVFTYADTGVFHTSVELLTYKGCSVTVTMNPEERWAIKVGEIPEISISYDKTEMCADDELEISLTFNDGNERYMSQFDTVSVTFVSEDDFSRLIFERHPMEESFKVKFTDTIGIHTSSYMVSDNGCRVQVNDGHQVMVNGPIIAIGLSETDCDNPYDYDAFFYIKLGVTSWDWVIKTKTDSIKIAENIDDVHIDFRNYGGRGKYTIAAYARNTDAGCEMIDSIQLQVTDIIAEYDMKHTTYCLNSTVDFVLDAEMGQDISQWKWVYNWNDSVASAVFASKEGSTITRYDQPYYTTEIDECGNVYTIEHWPPRSMYYRIDTTNISSISVVASDIHGCTDTISKPIQIVAPKTDFSCDIPADCPPFVTTLTSKNLSNSSITKRKWYIDNKLVDDENNESITETIETQGYKTVKLIVFDDFGCSDTAIKVDFIKPTVPNASFSVDHPKLCLGFDATFTRNLNKLGYEDNLSHYSWNFGDNTMVVEDGDLPKTTTHTYSEAKYTPYEVKLVAYCTSPEGHECVDSSTQEIDIKNVGANIKIKDADKCKEPGQKYIVYIDNSIYNNYVNAFSWWKIDGGDSLYVSNKRSIQVVTFDNYGDQSLWLNTKSNYWGCEDTTFSVSVVVPGYEASLLADKNEVCIHEDVTFTIFDTLNLHRYDCYWEFGDGVSMEFSDTSIQHQYTALSANEDNVYKVQFFVDAPGCKTRDISVSINTFPVIAMFTRGLEDLDTIACAPYSVTLYNTSVASKDATYLWDLGNGKTSTEKNPTITIEDPNMVIPVSLSLTSHICNDKLQKNVKTYPVPDVTFALDTAICVGENISAVATGDFTSIIWKPVELFTNSRNAKTDIHISRSQDIYVETKNEYNCNRIDTIPIFVQQKPYYLGAPDFEIVYYAADGSPVVGNTHTHTLIAGESYNVNTKEIPGVSYSWTPSSFLSCSDCSSPDIDLHCGDGALYDCMDFPESLDYTIYMQDSLGCFTNDTTIHFDVGFDSKIALPEAFTPNGDGINDVAYVQGWGIKEFLEVKIYNRWGQVVFESDNMAIGWDGTFKGEPQGMDTYSYKIKAISIRNEEMFEKGYITLIR